MVHFQRFTKKQYFLKKYLFQKRIKKSRVENPQVLSHLLLVVAIFPVPHPCAIRFPRSNRQIPTSPISFAFCGRYFSLAAPTCHWISQVESPNKSPQVLSHLLLVVAIFPLPHPGAIRFPSSKRQIPTSPISSAFVVAIFPLPHPCAIRFPSSNRPISTSPISSAFSGRYFFLAAPMCH